MHKSIAHLHGYSINSPSLRERVGVRGSKKEVMPCFMYPLILAFSLGEKGWLRLKDEVISCLQWLRLTEYFENNSGIQYHYNINGTEIIYLILLLFISGNAIAVNGDPAMMFAELNISGEEELLDCLLEPNEEIKLSSQIPGILDTMKVERGDHVRRGQIVARLKSGVERAAVALAQARVDFGKRKLVRNEDLYNQELISIHEKDEMETEHRIAELELQEAKEKLKLRTLRSPISGIVTERHHSGGEFVGEDPVLTLVSIDPLNVEIIVPVSRIGSIHKGMEATVEPEYPAGDSFTGKVDIVDQIIDAASGTFTVSVKLPNPKHRIAAGLKCQVRFHAP